jgi:hypothetical protein
VTSDKMANQVFALAAAAGQSGELADVIGSAVI